MPGRDQEEGRKQSAVPQVKPVPFLQLDLPPLREEALIDRSSQNSVRSRMESLRMEASELEVQIRHLTDALETLVRIQNRFGLRLLLLSFAKLHLGLLQESGLTAVQQGQRAPGGHQPQEVRPESGADPPGGGQGSGRMETTTESITSIMKE